MQFPYKIYQARNVSVPAYTYLGKAAIAGYYGAKTSNFPHQVRKDCQDLFLFATVVGGKNIKITAATEDDPYMYFDTRWTNFSYDTDTSASCSFIKQVTTDSNFTLKADFRTINTDGSLLLKSGANSKFFWNGIENIIDPDIPANPDCQNDNVTEEDGQIIIKRHDYTLVDNPITKPFWEKRAVSLIDSRIVDQDNYKVSMQLKSIVGSECIKVESTSRGTIRISYNKALCPCGCFDADTSVSSSSSSIEICVGLSEECRSSSSMSLHSTSSSSSPSSFSSNSSSSNSSSSRSSQSERSSPSSRSLSSPSSNSSSSSKSSVSSNSSSSSSRDNRCEPFIFPTISVPNSLYGKSVAVSENGAFLVIGASNEKAIYIFSSPTTLPTGRPGYTQVRKVTHADADFGWSVDISADGEWILVGAPGYNNDQGRVHIFSKTTNGGTWGTVTVPTYTVTGTGTLQKALTVNKIGHRFGHSVSVNPNAVVATVNILVGCPYFTRNPSVNGINAGAAFAFYKSGVSWIESIITPNDLQQQDFFGWDVALTPLGTNAVIGSVNDNELGINCGSAYVYTYGTSWTLVNKLVAADRAQADAYGYSVAIGQNGATLYVAVGAPRKDNIGALYLYDNSSGWLETKAIAPSYTMATGFGFSVAMNGCGSMVVASSVPANHDYEPYSGFVDLITRNSTRGWSTDDQVIFRGNNFGDGYGYAVDITNTGSHLLVSAPYNNNKAGFAQLISFASDCYGLTVPCAGEDRSSKSSNSSSSNSSSSSYEAEEMVLNYSAGSNGYYLHTSPDGRNYSYITQVTPPTYPGNMMLYQFKGYWYWSRNRSSLSYGIFRSKDKKNWTFVSSTPSVFISNFIGDPATNTIVAFGEGAASYYWYSIDGGLNWTQVNMIYPEYISSACFFRGKFALGVWNATTGYSGIKTLDNPGSPQSTATQNCSIYGVRLQNMTVMDDKLHFTLSYAYSTEGLSINYLNTLPLGTWSPILFSTKVYTYNTYASRFFACGNGRVATLDSSNYLLLSNGASPTYLGTYNSVWFNPLDKMFYAKQVNPTFKIYKSSDLITWIDDTTPFLNLSSGGAWWVSFGEESHDRFSSSSNSSNSSSSTSSSSISSPSSASSSSNSSSSFSSSSSSGSSSSSHSISSWSSPSESSDSFAPVGSWIVNGDGSFTSPDIGDGGTTSMTSVSRYYSGGMVSFDFHLESEQSYDFLRFYVDNVQQSGAAWSGVMTNSYSIYVPPGNHIFKWTYSKDGSASVGTDNATIYNIVLPPHDQTSSSSSRSPSSDSSKSTSSSSSSISSPSSDSVSLSSPSSASSDQSVIIDVDNGFTWNGASTRFSSITQTPNTQISTSITRETDAGNINFTLFNSSGNATTGTFGPWKFYIDDVLMGTYTPYYAFPIYYYTNNNISFPVTEGLHVFRWTLDNTENKTVPSGYSQLIINSLPSDIKSSLSSSSYSHSFSSNSPSSVSSKSPSSPSSNSSSSSSDDKNGLTAVINDNGQVQTYVGFNYNLNSQYIPGAVRVYARTITGFLRTPVSETATFLMWYKNSSYSLYIKRQSDNAVILSDIANYNIGFSTVTERNNREFYRTLTCSLVANEVYTVELYVTTDVVNPNIPFPWIQQFEFHTPFLISENLYKSFYADGVSQDRHNHQDFFYTTLPIPAWTDKSSSSLSSSESYSSNSISSFSNSYSSGDEHSSESYDTDPNRGINGWRHDSWRTYSYNGQPAPWAYDTIFTYPSFYWDHNPVTSSPYGANDQWGYIKAWIMIPTSEALTITNHTQNLQQYISLDGVRLCSNQMFNSDQVTSKTVWLNGGQYYYLEIDFIASTSGTPSWLRSISFRTNSISLDEFSNHALRYFFKNHP